MWALMRPTTLIPIALCMITLLQGSGISAQLPGTPAARQFAAWRKAQDSGDRATVQRFLEEHMPWGRVEQELEIGRRTGGYDVKKVEESTNTEIVVLVQERGSTQLFARIRLVVAAEAPHRITGIRIQSTQPPPEFAPPRLSEDELIAALREKLERDAAEDRFAGAVLLGRLENGASRVLFSGAWGFSDRENKAVNTPDTRFRIGSMNKMFTAVAILQLVQAGKIKLTDPVGKYLTNYPNQDVATKVTIHHLLTHTGGTGDIFGPQYSARRLELRTLGDYVTLYGERAPAFEPGSRWAYSNYGMLLLGVVIERVSGQSYYDYVAERIYRPAGMTRSGSEPESEAVPGRSVGYMRLPTEGWTPNTATLPYRGTSAGGGYSTVGDLMKFATALMGHKLLNTECTNLLLTGKVATPGGRAYAYGFEDGRKSGEGAVGHGGGAPGMNGDLRIYPQSGYVVAVLSNLDPPAASQVSAFLDLRLPK